MFGQKKSQPARRLEFPPPIDITEVVEADTEVGKLFLHAHDKVMTPAIVDTGRWEPEEMKFLLRSLAPGHTFLDCGANFGYFSVLGSNQVGPAGQVISIEPEDRNLTLLRANLWRNSCWNVDINPIAAYSYTGFVSFHSNEDNRGDHQVGRDSQSSRHVPCARLDEILAGKQIDVAKIDTQGVDHEVIAGMSGLLNGGHTTLLVEYWLEGMEERQVDPLTVLSGYRALGLEVGLLTAEGESRAASNDQVIEACEAWAGRFVNLVLDAR